MISSLPLSIIAFLILAFATLLTLWEVGESKEAKKKNSNLFHNTQPSSGKKEGVHKNFTATKSANSLQSSQDPLVSLRAELIEERDRLANEGLGPKHPKMLFLSEEIEKRERNIKRHAQFPSSELKLR